MTLGTVPTQLRRPTAKEGRELFGLFASHFIGGLLPLWGSWLLLVLAKEWAPFSEFIRHGEFLLYAASLLPTAAFLVLRDLKSPFPHRMLLGLVTIFLLVVSTLGFAGVFIVTRHDAAAGVSSVDIRVLMWVSIPLYVVALFATLTATFFDMIVLGYDPLQKQEQDERDLAEQFRKIKE